VPAVLDRNIFRPGQGGSLAISFKCPQDGTVRVKVYNLAGQLVRPVFDAPVQAGLWFQATWDGRNDRGDTISSGVYFISIRGAGIRTLRRVVVIK
jgi:flagellar hook assembly protein FlgD